MVWYPCVRRVDQRAASSAREVLHGCASRHQLRPGGVGPRLQRSGASRKNRFFRLGAVSRLWPCSSDRFDMAVGSRRTHAGRQPRRLLNSPADARHAAALAYPPRSSCRCCCRPLHQLAEPSTGAGRDNSGFGRGYPDDRRTALRGRPCAVDRFRSGDMAPRRHRSAAMARTRPQACSRDAGLSSAASQSEPLAARRQLRGFDHVMGSVVRNGQTERPAATRRTRWTSGAARSTAGADPRRSTPRVQQGRSTSNHFDAPRSLEVSVAASAAARQAMKIVSSPQIVPTISGKRGLVERDSDEMRRTRRSPDHDEARSRFDRAHPVAEHRGQQSGAPFARLRATHS